MGQSRSQAWRPVVADGALAALLLFSALSWAIRALAAHEIAAPGVVATFAICFALTGPLLWRRRRPVLAFAVIAVAAFAQWLTSVAGWLPLRIAGPEDLAVLVALYTVAAYSTRRWSLAALAVALLGGALLWGAAHAHRETGYLGLLPPTVAVLAVWLLGRNLRTRREYLAELEERAVRLERERDALARAAVAEERGRIAREMHDVVAHTVAVMVAQADGASEAIRGSPERAEQALRVISDAGRSALAELRRMLGVLREQGEHGEQVGTGPQPALDDVDALVSSMRASGLAITYVREGTGGQLEPTLSLAAYRIVQESLTNTLKHRGPDTSTELRCRHTPEAIEIEVVDRGGGPVGRPPEGPTYSGPTAGPTAGHGLTGMRERVALFGGQLSVGPTATGGWRVHAVLPSSGSTA